MTLRLRVSLLCLAAAVACAGNATEDAKSPEAAPPTTQSDFDACALLTADEINAAVGWTPDSSQKKSYGATGNCTYFGPKGIQQVTVLVGQGMPDMSDSRKMADWRAKQYANMKVTDAVVEPVEGLGVPAIRNEYGIVAIEMVIGSQLVTVSSIGAKFDEVRTLAGHIVGRMK